MTAHTTSGRGGAGAQAEAEATTARFKPCASGPDGLNCRHLGNLREGTMCRNIRPLYNFEPPATEEEIRAASVQFVRKVSGFQKPSQANAAPCERAVDEITACLHRMLDDLVTQAPPKDRAAEAAKARLRSAQRFGQG